MARLAGRQKGEGDILLSVGRSKLVEEFDPTALLNEFEWSHKVQVGIERNGKIVRKLFVDLPH